MQPFYIIVRPLAVQRGVATPAMLLIAAGSLLLLVSAGGDHLFFKVENAILEDFILAAEVGMGLLITYLIVQPPKPQAPPPAGPSGAAVTESSAIEIEKEKEEG